MVARTLSASRLGVEGIPIEVEAAREPANPLIHVTGLPGSIVKESRERVRVALGSLGYAVPTGRLLLHLLPATAPKQGSQFDLAMAVAVLGAESLLPPKALEGLALLGELTLDGRLLPVTGILALAEALIRRNDVRAVVVPEGNGSEVALLKSTKIRLARHLAEVLEFAQGKRDLPPALESTGVFPPRFGPGLDAIRGLELGKRALQIALAGRHHLLLVGPPGVGKTLLAQTAVSLLPPLRPEAWLDVLKNHAQAPGESPPWSTAPFRSPHHTISGAALLGGGSGTVIPGEVTLAHHGVLFLDELAEFRKEALEGLREPVQNGSIQLHRIGHALSLPARFTLLAAMNPCPCGYSLAASGRCRCSRERIGRYRKRLSGPLLDRFDLFVVVSAADAAVGASGVTHSACADEIARAVDRQRDRYREEGIEARNGDAPMDLKCGPFALGEAEGRWFDRILRSEGASLRSAYRSVRVARTLSDLRGEDAVTVDALREAWTLRCSDSQGRLFGA